MEPLRVLTWNIWGRQGPWPARLPLLREAIARLDPHVVGLQEVLHRDTGAAPGASTNQALEIGGALGYGLVFGPSFRLADGQDFGNALLTRFPAREAEALVLPGAPGAEPRSLLAARLETPLGLLPVFNTHLDWPLDGGHVRQLQTEAIAQAIEARCPPGATLPPVLMGDLNAEPDADEVRFLRGLTGRRRVHFADCWLVAGDGSPGYTFARANAFAAQVGEPDRRIDYLFVRGPDKRKRGQVHVARLVGTEAREGVFPSDHFGVYAEIHLG